MKNSRRLVVPLLLACSISVAHADNDDVIVGNKTTKTAISGHTGTESYLGWKPRANSWLYAVGWSERKDAPCFLRLYGARYQNGSLEFGWHKNNVAQWPVSSPHRKLEMCKDKPTSLKVAGAALGAKPEALRVIRGISVCTSEKKRSARERLKGIRVWSAQLDVRTGKVSHEEATEHAYRNHCKTWHPRRTCPAGQGAIGLRVIHASGELRGLGLVCAPFSVGMTRPR